MEHYWLVGIDRRCIECLRLDRREYTLAVRAEGAATLEHPVWEGLSIDLDALSR